MGLFRKLLRWTLKTALLILGPAAVMIAGLYFYMTTGRYVTTENAYTKADLIVVTAEVTGRVVEVNIQDNQPVEPGQLLFRIDPRRFEIERARRMADLGAARQRVQALKARHRIKVAELAAAQADAVFLRAELERSERLRKKGTISEFRVLEVRRETDKAEHQLHVIREQLQAVLAEIGDPRLPDDNHPDVMHAMAEYDRADLELASTAVHAPVHATAANVRLQTGEYVGQGTPVLSLVSGDGFWIEANLKETDLTHLEIGQAATLTVDAYPEVAWTAEVASVAPATGAEYALLPPQNATGNWVKVVQRVPVRLDITIPEGAPPLRAGMSVAVSIDTHFERPLPEVLSKARAWIRPDGEK